MIEEDGVTSWTAFPGEHGDLETPDKEDAYSSKLENNRPVHGRLQTTWNRGSYEHVPNSSATSMLFSRNGMRRRRAVVGLLVHSD